MSFLPKSAKLGNLEFIEVYGYYDKPCLFSCRNTTGQIFLAVWIDESSGMDEWLYAAVSARRLEEVRSGCIDLHSAFSATEDGFVFKVILPHGEGPAEVETVPCEKIEEDSLPMVGASLIH